MQTSTLRKPLELLTLLLAVTLIAAACGDDDDHSEPVPTTTAADAPDESQDDAGEDSGSLGEGDPGDSSLADTLAHPALALRHLNGGEPSPLTGQRICRV